MFKGVYTAIITPFRGDQIDKDALVQLIERQIAAGVDGIVPTGSTGETPTLSYEEQLEVIALTVKTVNKRCKVIPGTGANSTKKTIEMTQKAQALGIDGALVVAPYYNKPSQEGQYQHFTAVAKAVSDLPIMLYNVPSRTGVEIGASTIGRLAQDCANIVSLKEAGGSIERVSQIREHLGATPQFTILSGDDPMTLPMIAVGAVGVVSVASNILPKVVSELVKSALNQQWTQALAIHDQYFGFFKALFVEPNPVPLKTAMESVGLIPSSAVRLPLYSMTDQNKKMLLEMVTRLGLEKIIH